jgi:hypothetical protein
MAALSAVPSAAANALGSGKGKKLRTVEMHVRPSENGKYIVKHDLRDKQGRPPMDGQKDSKEYALEQAELQEHIAQHMPPTAAPDPADEEAEPGA